MAEDRERNFQTVRSALSRARAMQLGLAIFLAAIAATCGFAFEGDSTGARVMTYALMAFFGGLAALFLWVALVKTSPDRSPLVVALRDRPGDVVWLYVQDVKVDVSGIDAPVRDANVTARLADGSTVAITVH